MKLKQWLYGATALAMLAACSDKDIAPDTGVIGNTESRGSGYISIAIGMPTSTETRANDEFADGLTNEYDVKNLGILFFTGREDKANFLQGYNVTQYAFEDFDPKDDQVSAVKTVTFPVSIAQNSESLWALAVVNYNDIMSINEDGNVTMKNGNTVLTSATTITDVMDWTTSEELHNVTSTEGFFMTNTPYAIAPGTGVNNVPSGFVHLLASVDKGKIKETKEQAQNDPAAEIFVERAVAKVEVFKGNAIEGNGIPKIESIQWLIDNTEPSSYVVRHLNKTTESKDATNAPKWLAWTHTDGFSSTLLNKTPGYQPYRFVGYRPFNYSVTGSNNLNMYRVYFGYDPQGDGFTDGTSMIRHADDDNLARKFRPISKSDESNPQYCYENTFDVEHMDYNNTTRAILKVKFEGDDFFTRGIDRNTKYTHKDAATTFVSFVLQNSAVEKAYSDYFKDNTTVPTITITDLGNGNHEGEIHTMENNWIKVSLKTEHGKLKVTDVLLYDGTTSKTPVPFLAEEEKTADQVKEEAIAAVNEQVTFNYYEGGVAYYAVRIKHFGDDLTPWDEPKNDDGSVKPTPTTSASYDGIGDNANKNYLGRYGVLRNNWYQLTITNIDQFGEPTISDLPLDSTPDDKTEVKQSISCKINILSWAKRTQNVKL